MGRHKKIESLLLQELTANEERSERAWKIINHQRHTIYTLQNKLEQLKNVVVPPAPSTQNDQQALEEYEMIQREIQDLRATLQELKEAQRKYSVLPRHENFAPPKTFDNKRMSLDDFHHVNIPQSNNNLVLEIQKIKEQLEARFESETNLRRDMTLLNQKVVWLKKERDVVLAHMKDQTKFRHRVEMQLRDLSSGVIGQDEEHVIVQGDDIDMTSTQSRNTWRTARQFFTAEEAQFFLSARLGSVLNKP